tara:strand:- start:395 stop:628 length:234 start_codon:yes stop_codon:yes gene_type:complete
MYTAVTLSANVNAVLKLRFAKVLFKIGTPVHFSRDKMMVSKASFSITARALTNFICHKVTFSVYHIYYLCTQFSDYS